jgi:hypothetical protein
MARAPHAVQKVAPLVGEARRVIGFGGKTSVDVVMGIATHKRIRNDAWKAAEAAGFPKTHILAGQFAADQMSLNFERALASHATPAVPDLLSPSSDEETFVTVALSRTLARRLRREAVRAARRAGTATGTPRDNYVRYYLGHRLQAAYEASQA